VVSEMTGTQCTCLPRERMKGKNAISIVELHTPQEPTLASLYEYG
jgi:hypothetical protein